MKVKHLTPEIVGQERWDKLERYLVEHWDRAVRSRQTQVDQHQVNWSKNYYAEPLEQTRTVPWYKSSNIVVPLIRVFVDTFVARTMGIVFATRPLMSIDGYPAELRESLQHYLDRKALNEWGFYQLFNRTLLRGAKNGTVVTKVTWEEDYTIDVGPEKEEEVPTFIGPKSKVIPFEDFYCYPLTANDLSEVLIKFHRTRYAFEDAERRIEQGLWDLTTDDLANAAKMPKDARRGSEQAEAGLYDREFKELQIVECYLNYAITNDSGRFYSLVCLVCPELKKLVDVYYNPYPSNYENFYLYSPNPREDCIYGQSWSETLAQFQEEVSQIHNDRRNSSFLVSAPVFKRRNASLLPNPSTNWYPGKVFDLDSMEDLEVVQLAGARLDMINEEMHVISLAERLVGIGAPMQGLSTGQRDKRGVYNTGGVLAMMSEGNQRQDTNIRDARQVLGDIAKCSYFLQAHFGRNDPSLELFPPKVKQEVLAAFEQTNRDRLRFAKFEIKASSAASNRELEKASLSQMSNVLAQHSQTILALTPQVLGAANPQHKAMIYGVMRLSSWMAKRLLAAYEEFDTQEVLPDVDGIIGGGGAAPPNGQGAASQGMVGGGPAGPGAPPSREVLQQMASLSGPNA